MNILTIMVVVASLLTSASLSIVPVSVEASTARSRSELRITEETTEEKTKFSDEHSGVAPIRQFNSFTQDFTENEDPAARITIDLNVGGQLIQKETTSARASQSSINIVTFTNSRATID